MESTEAFVTSFNEFVTVFRVLNPLKIGVFEEHAHSRSIIGAVFFHYKTGGYARENDVCNFFANQGGFNCLTQNKGCHVNQLHIS